MRKEDNCIESEAKRIGIFNLSICLLHYNITDTLTGNTINYYKLIVYKERYFMRRSKITIGKNFCDNFLLGKVY